SHKSINFMTHVVYIGLDVLFFVTIQLLKPNNSTLDNTSLRTASSIQPLFIQFPLVADKATKRALMPLFFSSTSKNIRA
ncbi:MAG: hypothetical protein LBK06_11010, partial [Planctomycetaceae bacterium]|nr:hypothetical protein [Planctomycetaceae bacterium]